MATIKNFEVEELFDFLSSSGELSEETIESFGLTESVVLCFSTSMMRT